jgi:tRNA A37 threonylcarbamoyladenosine synthetase subunit TsaC/SUA5/YrdC
MPLHPVAWPCSSSTGPLAVSSANRTGPPAVDGASEAREQLGDDRRRLPRAGPVGDPVPSTIVDLTGDPAAAAALGRARPEQLRESRARLQTGGLTPSPAARSRPAPPGGAAARTGGDA